MAIQIFGTKKCKTTQKAVRFFKERGVTAHLLDIKERGPSKGELKSISRSVPLEDLINTESKEYEKKGLKYIKHDIEEVLQEEPLLMTTPVVRSGNKAVAGFEPKAWEEMVLAEKK
ncbi:MAG: ArsC family transcriptional regulator [bacterium]|nr:ArsC family transcriptional regulator [bacterium]